METRIKCSCFEDWKITNKQTLTRLKDEAKGIHDIQTTRIEHQYRCETAGQGVEV